MKRLLLLLIAISIFFPVFSQRIDITGFNVSHELSGDVNLWGPAAANALAKSTNLQRGSYEAKLIVTVKKGGAFVCGNNGTSTSGETILTKAITTRDIVFALGNCMLNPGTYLLCLKYVNAEGKDLSDEVCREFTVGEPKRPVGNPLDPDTLPGAVSSPSNPATPGSKAPVNYRGPQLILPANGKKFNLDDLKKPVTFQWTQVTPSLKNPNDVTYTLRIYEMTDGQTPEQASRSNQSIIEKTLKTTQALVQIPSEYLEAGKQFGWNVEAVGKNGERYGEKTETRSFMTGTHTIGLQTDSFIVSCTNTPGKYSFKFCVTNITTANSSSTPIAVNLTSLSVNSSTPVATNTISGVTIPSPIGASSSICITGTINSSSSVLSSITLKYTIEDPGMSGRTATDFATTTVPQCYFSCCQDVIKAVTQTTNSSSGLSIINITLKAGPKPMKKVQLELVYVKAVTNENCPICKNRWQWWGNFF